MTWGHVGRIEGCEVHSGFWCGILRERDHLEDTGVYGRIIQGVSKRALQL